MSQEWYDNRDDLAELYEFMDTIGYTPDMPYFIEKPWKWDGEFNFMKKHDNWREYNDDMIEDTTEEFFNLFVITGK